MIELTSREELLALHEVLIEAFGGAMGIRDEGLLDSALTQPRQAFGGKELHLDLFSKVAALAFSLVKNHPFLDGDNRVGAAAMDVVLRRNGYRFECTADEGEAIILRVASSTCGRDELLTWISDHGVPLN